MVGRHPLEAVHLEQSRPMTRLIWALAYVALLLNLLAFAGTGGRAAIGALVAIGLIGAWRWSWGGLHFVRAAIYRRRVFPLVRAAAATAGRPEQLLFLVTSFRIQPEVTDLVYARLFAEISQYGVPAVVVASVTDEADLKVIEARRAQQAPHCRVIFVAQTGAGKRSAMSDALRVLRHCAVGPSAQVILMDGDTALGQGALEKACSVLAAHQDVGAVTTENVPLVQGSVLAREWYRLRMAQRHNLMCSLSLSRKLLVLTGRFSVFRADLALTSGFIGAVAADEISHWRLGKIRLLTGDDKSTWFETLKSGRQMLYVPDSVAYSIEKLPGDGFFLPSVALMRRWYGNMLRSSGRAIALGPGRCGAFLWWCLIDQRVSMWTTLVGPASAAVLSAMYGVQLLLLYGVWILLSRGAVTVLLALSTGRFHPAFPLVLYYTQVIGALVKIHASFHMHRQKWNRQGISQHSNLLQDLTSYAYHRGAMITAAVLFLCLWAI